MVFNEQLSVFFVGTRSIEVPAGRDCMLVEGAQQSLLLFVGKGHVIFDCVQPAQNEVEYAYLKLSGVSEHQATSVAENSQLC